MRTHTWARALATAGAIVGLLAIGCHADPDDAAGQARELEDSVRRENAITNLHRLYTAALERASGDRTAAEPMAVADASIEGLTNCYVNHTEDITNAGAILDLLYEMRDARSLPALTKALDWRPEISEEHAITAARTLREIDIPAGERGAAVTAISTALERVTRNRGVDNRMRIEFIRTLGDTRDVAASPALRRIMLLQNENQAFLINREAAVHLGHLRDPAAVPDLLQALVLFDAANPAMRMNDVATAALVRIGAPALQPLVEMMQGRNTEVNAIATRMIAAIRERDADFASRMSVEALVSNEAATTLGQLGLPEAIDPLIAEATALDEGERADSVEEDLGDMQRMFGSAIALVSVSRRDTDTDRIRTTLMTVYNRLPAELDPTRPNRTQLLVAMQHFGDPGLIPFLIDLARPPARGPSDADLRVLAFRAAMMMANAAEAAQLQAIITAEPEGDIRDGFNQFEPEVIFTATTACNEDLTCWTGRLTDTDTNVVQKAAYMVARYGRGNAAAISALVAATSSRDETAVMEILYALDYCATGGSPEGVARIDTMREEGGGTAFWNHLESLAVVIQARLAARGGGD